MAATACQMGSWDCFKEGKDLAHCKEEKGICSVQPPDQASFPAVRTALLNNVQLQWALSAYPYIIYLSGIQMF